MPSPNNKCQNLLKRYDERGPSLYHVRAHLLGGELDRCSIHQGVHGHAHGVPCHVLTHSPLISFVNFCRLKNTYIYGYYLPEHVHRSIFEYLQGDLESGVEVIYSCCLPRNNSHF